MDNQQMQPLPTSLSGKIPVEIFENILSHLPQPSLLQCRLLSHQFKLPATRLAFQHVNLGAHEEHPNHERFIRLAQSDELRRLVREVTCDTWVGNQGVYGSNGEYEIPSDFLNALPYLRYFHNVNTLHLRFNKQCGHERELADWDLSVEESSDFRYRVLDTVFQCVAGTWSAEQQKAIDSTLNLDDYFQPRYDQRIPGEGSKGGNSLSKLQMLTISNLADYHDTRLTNSVAFKSVLGSPALVSLKLQITVHQDERGNEEFEFHYGAKYTMFECLPSTWLSSHLASHLATLSLYSREYWGWSPKMDFRAVGADKGSDSGFPQLKTLVLGRYVFSHEWQVDWVTSLGRNNGHGGLRELYLDDCPILYHTATRSPLFDTNTSVVVGQDPNGNDVVISNEGYLDKRLITPRPPPTTRGRPPCPYQYDYPLRWNSVLSRWRDSMRALRIFQMGQGALGMDTRELVDLANDAQTAVFHRSAGRENPHLLKEWRDEAFLNYRLPPPPGRSTDLSKVDMSKSKYAGGFGLARQRRHVLKYVHFFDKSYQSSDNVFNEHQKLVHNKEEDEAALESLLSTTDARNRAEVGA